MNIQLQTDNLLKKGLKMSHLRLLASLLVCEGLGAAAEHLNITQPAASRLMTEIERIVGVPVHERTGRGMRLTVVGEALARRAQRIQFELRDAARDIETITQGTFGTVRIGSVTGPAVERVLPALALARTEMPDVKIEIIVGPSDQLNQHLLDGRIDFSIGRLPENNENGLFDMQPLADEPIDLLVRRDHPLHRLTKIVPQDLLAYDWVMPGPESLLGRTVLARLRRHNIAAPRQQLSTTSFLLTLALLQHSDAIAPLARAVAGSFSAGPHTSYATLNIDLGITVETYGLVTLANVLLTPAAQRLAKIICAPVLN